ncbi:MAG: hypothetical protein O3C23_01815 [bacterium]|nr:hypothetical protein [bacterium]
MEPEFKQSPTPKEEPTEEKLEFLKREEVRTMEKDIAKIREEGAKAEQEHIAKPKEEAVPPKKPEVVLMQQSSFTPPALPKRPLIPRRPLKQREKLFIRIVAGGIFVFLVFNAVAFGFWFFFKKNAPVKQPAQDTQKEVVITPPPAMQPRPVEPLPVVSPLIPFFTAPEQKLALENQDELLPKLQEFLASAPALGLTNITLQTKENPLSVKELLYGLQITIPQELTAKLKENYMLFSYVAGEKKRLGFVVELKDTVEIQEILSSFEQNMEDSTASFFASIGQKGSAYTSLFRSTSYKGVPVRFQTFSMIDFGIVYGVINNTLLFTSSMESFQKVADLL